MTLTFPHFSLSGRSIENQNRLVSLRIGQSFQLFSHDLGAVRQIIDYNCFVFNSSENLISLECMLVNFVCSPTTY